MKQKLFALSMLLFLMGTTSGIYFLPTQEALFIARANVDETCQDISREFASTLKRPQLRSVAFSTQDIIKVLAQFLGITACGLLLVQFVLGASYRYTQSFAYNTPHKAKKLKRFRDDIL